MVAWEAGFRKLHEGIRATQDLNLLKGRRNSSSCLRIAFVLKENAFTFLNFNGRAITRPRMKLLVERGGSGCLNRISALVSGASAGVRLPYGEAAG